MATQGHGASSRWLLGKVDAGKMWILVCKENSIILRHTVERVLAVSVLPYHMLKLTCSLNCAALAGACASEISETLDERTML